MPDEISETDLTTASRDQGRVRGLLLLFSPAALSGALVALPFLYPGLFPLTWISLVPLLWGIERVRTRLRAFLLAWLAGAVALTLGFYWIEHTARVFGGFPHGLSEIVLLLFAILASLPIALFGLLVRLCGLGPLQVFPALL